ncbi:MAG: N-acetylmuramoyl-L-alanine amidase [Syntrophomonadaceae bacterium]|nr:N-acetylmuramoyl-L-alanine amidase [Syntrophomonadaceae bacterium]
MEIIWNPTPNFTAGRKRRVPVAIVNHITVGAFPGCLSWLCNPATQASAHYLINRTGAIYQLVDDEDTAWHAGIVNRPNWSSYDGTNPNRYTLGIEHEGFDGTLTENQYQATLWLHQQLIVKWRLPVTTNHIIGHYRIDSVNRPNCPGPNFPWPRLFADLAVPSTVDIFYNGQVTQGYVIDNHVWGPVRTIAEIMGRTVKWDAATNTAMVLPVNISAVPTTEIKVVIASITLPAKVFNQRTYAPIHALVEGLGHKVNWDPASNSVIII